MTGDTIGQYTVLDQLGAGGMGIVYRARDEKLQRDVALKFLPTQWSQDRKAKERFMQEARAASGLDHENICTVYEIGEADDGQLFIVMPFYQGDTLKYRLKNGALPADESADLVRQLLSGLGRAHEAGIVHRDVKPANIMVTERGQVKLLDFGIAKLEAGQRLTQTGSTLGTVSYMSPEQAVGAEVDYRTDLWSAGVVFYEMLTGKLPFAADYDQAVIYNILNNVPASPGAVDPRVSQLYSQATMAMLAKDVDDRPPDARTAIQLLASKGPEAATTDATATARAPTPVGLARFAIPVIGAVLVAGLAFALFKTSDLFQPESVVESENEIHAIAVIPFSNLRSDPETDFLGYALADQIIGSLAYVRNLLVRPSTSIRQYDGRSVTAKLVGEELAVDYVVAGNYLKEADQIRLTVEMVDVRTNEMVWREPIEIEYENAFHLQDIVSEKVLRRLEITFSQRERSRMQEGVSSDPLAYEYYLRALAYPTTVDGNLLGLEMAEKSVELDSMFAPAWNQLGYRLGQVGQFNLEGGDMTKRSADAFRRALDLNSDLLDALGNLSTANTDLGKIETGYEFANRMLEINPQSALGHFARGYALRYAGMMDESVAAMESAIRLDSTDRRFRSAGITFFQAQDYEQAVRAFDIEAGTPYSQGWKGMMHMTQGQPELARPLFEQVIEADPDALFGILSAALKGAIDGDYEAGIAAARRWEDANIADPEATYYNAWVYCANYEIDGCIRVFEHAVEKGYYNYPGILKDQLLDAARDDPRYDAILESARVKHEEFKARFFPDS